MPELKWRSPTEVTPTREYLVMASRLPLQRRLLIPWFLRYTLALQGQLRGARGLICYSLLAQLLRSQFWTLSVWEEEEALVEFARSMPHSQVMTALRPHLRGQKFVRWKVAGAEVPPTWHEAFSRLQDTP